jgi:hypothetical protein
MILILFQLTILIFTAWGWGFWLWKILKLDNRCLRWGWFFCGLAGFALCMLFLQNLVYLDFRINITGWIALAVALSGVVFSCKSWRRRNAPVRRRDRADQIWGALVFIIVFGCQAAALFHSGPANYYGKAQHDQVNYVLTAQFLVEKPFSTSLADAKEVPWLVIGVNWKHGRLGQSVANAYLGVVSLTDAKRSYGTLSIFVICLGALAVFVLARSLGMPTKIAGLAACWWGILPAITKMHLDGFFSQSSALFVFPAIAAFFYTKKGRIDRVQLTLQAIFLAYLLCVYTELYVIGVGIIVSLLLFNGRTRWSHRVAAALTIPIGSLLLASFYLPYLVTFLSNHYKVAAQPFFSGLVPMSGTWRGWAEIFFGQLSSSVLDLGLLTDAQAGQQFLQQAASMVTPELLNRIPIIIALALIVIGGFAFQGRSPAKNRFLLTTLLIPFSILILLLSATELPKYPFSKLLDTFTPFWVVIIALGFLRFSQGTFRHPAICKLSMLSFLLSLTALSFSGSVPHWREVIEGRGILATVDSNEARACYAIAESRRQDEFVIIESQDILCAWLVYHTRHAKTYLDADLISDVAVPDEQYAFRRIPTLAGKLTVLNSHGPNYTGLPEVIVRNPQGIDRDVKTNATWYWIGKEAVFEVLALSEFPQVGFYQIEFDATAGPANPEPRRTLALTAPDGEVQTASFVQPETVRFQIKTNRGRNLYRLEVVYPTEQTNKNPSDPRNHMVQIEHLEISKNKPSSDSRDIPPSLIPCSFSPETRESLVRKSIFGN